MCCEVCRWCSSGGENIPQWRAEAPPQEVESLVLWCWEKNLCSNVEQISDTWVTDHLTLYPPVSQWSIEIRTRLKGSSWKSSDLLTPCISELTSNCSVCYVLILSLHLCYIYLIFFLLISNKTVNVAQKERAAFCQTESWFNPSFPMSLDKMLKPKLCMVWMGLVD